MTTYRIKPINIIAILLCLIIITGCGKTAPEIEIYVLRAAQLGDSYIQDANPVITSQDIQAYDLKKHHIKLTDDCMKRLGKRNTEAMDQLGPYEKLSLGAKASHLLGGMYPDKFSIKVEGETIYEGTFEPPLFISNRPQGPFISDREDGFDIIRFDIGRGSVDVREDERLISALKENDMLLY